MTLPPLSDFTESEIEDVISILQEELTRRRMTSRNVAVEGGKPKCGQTIVHPAEESQQGQTQVPQTAATHSKGRKGAFKFAFEELGELFDRIGYKQWEETS